VPIFVPPRALPGPVALADVAAWQRHAGDRFEFRAVPGGHFFHRDDRAMVHTIVRTVIGEMA
jgi:surfactin synthase thioesterase subunit